MRGLLAYSGLTTKVRAMKGQLLSMEQYRFMASLDSVPEAVEFLRALPAYSDIFPDMDSEDLHRGTIERLLAGSLYRDYARLYRFAGMKQRRFFKLYFMHFEIDILKSCLRNAAAHQPVPIGLSRYEEFFRSHSKLNLAAIGTAATTKELIDSLEGTVYYSLLEGIRESGDGGHFDYEMALDLYYFNTTWKAIKKEIPKREQEAILQGFGTKLDLLNLQWIYRAKRYYTVSRDAAKKLLIPVRYRLHSEQLEQLIAAESMEDYFSILTETWYGTRIRALHLDERPNLEILYNTILSRIHRIAAGRQPYSISTLYSYLYFKEEEMQKIITVIEGIRYQLDDAEILDIINHDYNNKKHETGGNTP